MPSRLAAATPVAFRDPPQDAREPDLVLPAWIEPAVELLERVAPRLVAMARAGLAHPGTRRCADRIEEPLEHTDPRVVEDARAAPRSPRPSTSARGHTPLNRT